MAIAFALSTQPLERVRADVLAVPVFAGARSGPGVDLVQAALGDGLAAFLAEAGFTGKPDETLVVPMGAGAGPKVAVLVGVGERGRVTTDQLRRGAAAVARAASRARGVVTTLLEAAPDLDPARPRRPSPRASRSAPTASSPTSRRARRRSSPVSPSWAARVRRRAPGSTGASRSRTPWPGPATW